MTQEHEWHRDLAGLDYSGADETARIQEAMGNVTPKYYHNKERIDSALEHHETFHDSP